MKQIIVDFLIAYGLQAGVALIGGIVLYFVAKSKLEKVKTIREIAAKVFIMVEQAIPDNTPDKTALKIDKALKLFNAMYADIFGGEAPAGIVEFAQQIWKVASRQAKILKLDK